MLAPHSISMGRMCNSNNVWGGRASALHSVQGFLMSSSLSNPKIETGTESRRQQHALQPLGC